MKLLALLAAALVLSGCASGCEGSKEGGSVGALPSSEAPADAGNALLREMRANRGTKIKHANPGTVVPATSSTATPSP